MVKSHPEDHVSLCSSFFAWEETQRPYLFTWGGTQVWVGYGCASRSFDHHPITKPEKMQICNLCLNHLFLEGSFLNQSVLLPCKLGCKSTFWQPIGKLNEKIHWKLCILQKRALYLNQFSNKKGAIGKPERLKKAPYLGRTSPYPPVH